MLIIGCDLHTRFQQTAMLDSATDKIEVRRLSHERGEARRFHASLPVVVQNPSALGTKGLTDLDKWSVLFPSCPPSSPLPPLWPCSTASTCSFLRPSHLLAGVHLALA